MGMGDLEFIFDVVARQLPEAGVDFLMIGGHAVNYYGYSRATVDVDFMVASSQVSAVRSVMKAAGFVNVSESENVVFFNHPQKPFRVDFLRVDEGTMKVLVLGARTIEYAGQVLLVPKLLDLISMKLFAIKSGSMKREQKDLPDIVNLAQEHDLSLEHDLKPLCEQFADEVIYERLAQRIREMRRA